MLSVAKVSMTMGLVVISTGCVTNAPRQSESETSGSSSPQVNQPAQTNSGLFVFDPCSNASRNIGAGLGALAGYFLGKEVGGGKDSSAVVGALAGAALGGYIGADMDRKRCEIHKIAQRHSIQIETTTFDADGLAIKDGTIRNGKASEPAILAVRLQDPATAGGHFAVGSDVLTPAAEVYFSEIADTFKVAKSDQTKSPTKENLEPSQRKLFLVGHTDDTGATTLNANLSERRAKAVSTFLSKRGILVADIYYQGAGELYPIADNNTELGRAANRRVELIEVKNDTVFQKYLASRIVKPEFFRIEASPQVLANQSSASNAATASNSTKNNKSKAKVQSNHVAKIEVKQSETLAGLSSQGNKVGVTAGVLPVQSKPVIEASKVLPKNWVDFGGVPYSEDKAKIDTGALISSGGFSFFSKAYADTPSVLRSCRYDRPRMAGEIRALADHRAIRTSEYLPGLYGRTWSDMVKDHLVVINKVAVLRDGGVPANLPEFKVYKSYDKAKASSARADMSWNPQVNVYQGANGVLYRMFFDGSAGARCADILTPNQPPFIAVSGRIIYQGAGGDFVAPFNPRLAL